MIWGKAQHKCVDCVWCSCEAICWVYECQCSLADWRWWRSVPVKLLAVQCFVRWLQGVDPWRLYYIECCLNFWYTFSHTGTGHVGSIVHSVAIVWTVTALHLYSAVLTWWLYDSTNCRPVRSVVMYSFTAREQVLSSACSVWWCPLEFNLSVQDLKADIISLSSLFFVVRRNIVFSL